MIHLVFKKNVRGWKCGLVAWDFGDGKTGPGLKVQNVPKDSTMEEDRYMMICYLKIISGRTVMSAKSNCIYSTVN